MSNSSRNQTRCSRSRASFRGYKPRMLQLVTRPKTMGSAYLKCLLFSAAQVYQPKIATEILVSLPLNLCLWSKNHSNIDVWLPCNLIGRKTKKLYQMEIYIFKSILLAQNEEKNQYTFTCVNVYGKICILLEMIKIFHI